MTEIPRETLERWALAVHEWLSADNHGSGVIADAIVGTKLDRRAVMAGIQVLRDEGLWVIQVDDDHEEVPRRAHAVPTTCPFTVGQTVRNTRLGTTGRVLEQLHDPLMPGSWWVRVHVDAQPDTRWLASLCEVA